MLHVPTTKSRLAITVAAFIGSLVLVEAARASHDGWRRGGHPAAEAHMNAAIRLMTLACDKTIHVSRHLAGVAVKHVSRARRLVRSPDARAELSSAKRTLDRFIYGHCRPPFHGAIQRTRLALDLERDLCVCGRPTCNGRCHGPLPQRPHVNREGYLPPPRDRLRDFDASNSRNHRGRGLDHEFDRVTLESNFRQTAVNHGGRLNSFHGLWNEVAPWFH